MLYNIVARHISTPLGRDHSPPPLPHVPTQLPAKTEAGRKKRAVKFFFCIVKEFVLPLQRFRRHNNTDSGPLAQLVRAPDS